MTDKTVSKLEWFMRRPPYYAKYQGGEKEKENVYSFKPSFALFTVFL